MIGLKIKKLIKQLLSKSFQQTNKGLIVRPEGCEMDFPIKKSNIAINAADAQELRRWTGGEKLIVQLQTFRFRKKKSNP